MPKPFCPNCKEDLRQAEADFMKLKELKECVKCRAKREKAIINKK